MIERPNNLDPVEALLRDLNDAERAGVFNRTSVASEWLRKTGEVQSGAAQPLPAWVVSIRRRWVPVAAALALAVTAWSVLFSLELNRLKDERSDALAARSATSYPFGDQFAVACLNGPGGPMDEQCRPLDLDADQRVTLADFGVLQRTMGHRAN